MTFFLNLQSYVVWSKDNMSRVTSKESIGKFIEVLGFDESNLEPSKYSTSELTQFNLNTNEGSTIHIAIDNGRYSDRDLEDMLSLCARDKPTILILKSTTLLSFYINPYSAQWRKDTKIYSMDLEKLSNRDFKFLNLLTSSNIDSDNTRDILNRYILQKHFLTFREEMILGDNLFSSILASNNLSNTTVTKASLNRIFISWAEKYLGIDEFLKSTAKYEGCYSLEYIDKFLRTKLKTFSNTNKIKGVSIFDRKDTTFSGFRNCLSKILSVISEDRTTEEIKGYFKRYSSSKTNKWGKLRLDDEWGEIETIDESKYSVITIKCLDDYLDIYILKEIEGKLFYSYTCDLLSHFGVSYRNINVEL